MASKQIFKENKHNLIKYNKLCSIPILPKMKGSYLAMSFSKSNLKKSLSQHHDKCISESLDLEKAKLRLHYEIKKMTYKKFNSYYTIKKKQPFNPKTQISEQKDVLKSLNPQKKLHFIEVKDLNQSQCFDQIDLKQQKVKKSFIPNAIKIKINSNNNYSNSETELKRINIKNDSIESSYRNPSVIIMPTIKYNNLHLKILDSEEKKMQSIIKAQKERKKYFHKKDYSINSRQNQMFYPFEIKDNIQNANNLKSQKSRTNISKENKKNMLFNRKNLNLKPLQKGILTDDNSQQVHLSQYLQEYWQQNSQKRPLQDDKIVGWL